MVLEELLQDYSKKDGKIIAIVIPVFNEDKCLPLVVPDIINYLNENQAKYLWQLIFVDDCSTDSSYGYLKKCAEDISQNVKIVACRLAKNSGSHIAISAGLNYSNGDFTIVMASDGQDPPEMIGNLVSEW